MLRGMAAGALLAIAGCAANPGDEEMSASDGHALEADNGPRIWHASTAFTDEERDSIRAGRRWLEEHTRQPILVVFDDAPAPVRIVRDPAFGPSTGVCLGWSDHVGGTTVILNPNRTEEMHPLANVLAHELAHCEYGFRDAYWPSPIISQGLMGNGMVPWKWTDFEDGELALFNSRRRDRSPAADPRP